MKKLLSIAFFISALAATADDAVVTYDDTTYGPSDTIVHYDMPDTDKEKSAATDNRPNDELYSSNEEK